MKSKQTQVHGGLWNCQGNGENVILKVHCFLFVTCRWLSSALWISIIRWLTLSILTCQNWKVDTRMNFQCMIQWIQSLYWLQKHFDELEKCFGFFLIEWVLPSGNEKTGCQSLQKVDYQKDICKHVLFSCDNPLWQQYAPCKVNNQQIQD